MTGSSWSGVNDPAMKMQAWQEGEIMTSHKQHMELVAQRCLARAINATSQRQHNSETSTRHVYCKGPIWADHEGCIQVGHGKHRRTMVSRHDQTAMVQIRAMARSICATATLEMIIVDRHPTYSRRDMHGQFYCNTALAEHESII